MFGSERLGGAGDFTQEPRTFEGGMGIIRVADWTVSSFWAQPVVVDKYRFNESTSDQRFFGVFATGPLLLLPVNLDLYWLSADNAAATFNGTAGRERRHTFGGRTWGKIGQTGLDFEVEGAAQVGTVGRGDVPPSMLTPVVCYIRPLLGYAGYGRFLAGEFIRRPGRSRDSDFLYGALQYTF